MCDEHRMLAVSRTDAQNALNHQLFVFPIVYIARFSVRIISAGGKATTGSDREMELPCSSRQAFCQPGHRTQRWRAGLDQLRSRGGMSCLLDPAGVQISRVGRSCPERSDDGMCAVGASLFFVPCERAEPPAGEFAWKARDRTASKWGNPLSVFTQLLRTVFLIKAS